MVTTKVLPQFSHSCLAFELPLLTFFTASGFFR